MELGSVRIVGGDARLRSIVHDALTGAGYSLDPLGEDRPAGEAGTVVELAQADRLDTACPLSSRQLEVLVCLGRGERPKQVARALGISVSTCRDHVKAIRTALDVTSVVEALLVAVGRGWIVLAPPR